MFCHRSTRSSFSGLWRCAVCTGSNPIDRPDQLADRTAPVLRALQAAGVTFSRDITVELRSSERIRTVSGRRVLGLTRTSVAGDSRTVGRIVITLLAGMPPAHFAMTLAHELGHAVMYDRGITTGPATHTEGMAEFFAHTYLTRPAATEAEKRLATSIENNPDPVYGDGFRVIRTAVARRGFRQVFVDLYHGRYEGIEHSPDTARR